MTLRNYSNTTPVVTLVSAIDAAAVAITCSNSSDVFPAVPFTMVLDPDTVSEEVVEVTSKNGTNNFFTITRGVDGTTAKSHSAGSQAIHGVSARDFTEAVKSTDVLQIVELTQAAYDALSPKDANTLYVING
jgi:hypothetical protein